MFTGFDCFFVDGIFRIECLFPAHLFAHTIHPFFLLFFKFWILIIFEITQSRTSITAVFTIGGDGKIIDREGTSYAKGLRDIIQLEGIDENFWSRFSGALDVGFNLAKTNNNRQLTISGYLNYASETWNTKFDYNTLYTEQDNTERIERKTMSLVAQHYIKEWYVGGSASYLQSSEQGILNRITPALGMGRYLIGTPKLFWIAGIGVTYNIEDFVDQQLNKKSTELQLLTQFEMFNFEDFSFSTKVAAYPSLSEKGRFRTDYNLVMKYDLPLDFYIKAEFTLNYDNQPAIQGNFTDYIFFSGFGWEL